MIAFFDTLALIGFMSAGGVAIVAFVAGRRASIKVTSPLYLLGAMLLMTYVSLSNVLEHANITATWDYWEDHAEIAFLPLLTYMLFLMYTESMALRAARQHGIASRLSERLNDSMARLDEHRLGLLQALSNAVDARDHYTALHSIHVADYAVAVARQLGMDDDLDMIEQAGLLHDVGKIGIRDDILMKPTGLTKDEYKEIMKHAAESARIIASVPFLSGAIDTVRHHHERWDGSGYPDGLRAHDIPRGARVLAVADAFDAMTTDRPYRAALSVSTARDILADGAGRQFDPEAVEALIALLDKGVVRVWDHGAVA